MLPGLEPLPHAPDGTGMEQLTHYDMEALRATQPRYTPDGSGIVFTAAVTAATRSLWAIPADGGEPIVLTPPGTTRTALATDSRLDVSASQPSRHGAW